MQTRLYFHQCVIGDRPGALIKAQPAEKLPHRLNTQGAQRADGVFAQAQLQRHWIQALAPALRAERRRRGAFQPLGFFAALLGIEVIEPEPRAATALAPALR